MGFSIGIIELALVGCLAICTVTLAVLGARAWRWGAVALCGTLVASILSPADPASTLLLATACCVFFFGGTRFGRSRRVVAD